MDIRPIKTDADHKDALKEIDRLWKSPEGSPEGDKLDVLITLVEAYEGERWPVEVEGDPVEVIIAHMDVTGRSQADLAQLLGVAFAGLRGAEPQKSPDPRNDPQA